MGHLFLATTPELGRFITEDPAGDGLNWYVYCSNSPITRIDPDGLADGVYVLSTLSSIGWLPAIDGPFPFGDAVLGIAVIGAGTYDAYLIYKNWVAAKKASEDKVKLTSPNQMQEQVAKEHAPKSVDRVDKGNPDDKEQDHIHFKNGSALNKDGSWKHGEKTLTNAEKEWISDNG